MENGNNQHVYEVFMPNIYTKPTWMLFLMRWMLLSLKS